MFDFGFLFRNWEVATNAAREGARDRRAAVYTCDDTTPTSRTASTPTWRRRYHAAAYR
jgi:hypothetical protein